MFRDQNVFPVILLRPADAGRYLQLSQSTLAKLRCSGGGPEYLKFGRSVKYEIRQLDAWLDQRRARNTSDATRLPARLTPSGGNNRPVMHVAEAPVADLSVDTASDGPISAATGKRRSARKLRRVSGSSTSQLHKRAAGLE